MRHALVSGLFVIAVFAGCVGTEGTGVETSDAPEENTPVEPGDVDPNSEFGVVQGTILSDEQTPIPNALVGLRGTAFADPTDLSGTFVFRDVPPGTYTLDVGALGFASQAKSIEVTAGQITPVSMFLSAVMLASEVYYEILPHTGFFDCALAT